MSKKVIIPPFKTLQIAYPIGRTIFLSILFIPIILLVLEGVFRIIPISENVLIPSIDSEINYPEIDLKLSRLTTIQKEKSINCLLLGNSMADFGLDPEIFNNQPNISGIKNPACFNIALESIMPETSSVLAEVLITRVNPSIIVLGISAIDLAGMEYETRGYAATPWFQYRSGIFSFEGWLIENSILYRYWISFKKYRDPLYRSELSNQIKLINFSGLQIREQDPELYKVQIIQKFLQYKIYKPDLDGLENIARLNSPSLKIIIVEMPVHPDFLPYYVPGGKTGYVNLFIEPVQNMLGNYGIQLIRTQPQIESVITADGWIDDSHLNKKGAMQFSTWIANKLQK